MGKLYGHRTVASGEKFALLEEYSPLPADQPTQNPTFGIKLVPTLISSPLYHAQSSRDWNDLPSNITSIEDHNQFKEPVLKHLKAKEINTRDIVCMRTYPGSR